MWVSETADHNILFTNWLLELDLSPCNKIFDFMGRSQTTLTSKREGDMPNVNDTT